ncbi:MAG: homocysteine S-methyltransferase family protein [Silicimonas sp.]|nr:homocysteine S-methyltransferase family protein [Silicimonas sp.]
MTEITLLDGGMGQELVHRSGDKPTPLWATQVMLDRPGLVEAIHRDYFDAGATVATTNTYAIHRDRLLGTGLIDRFDGLVAAALDEAHRAAGGNPNTRIAGSIGPLGASYRPDLHPPHDKAVHLYTELVRLIVRRANLLLFETVASVAHARAALQAGRTADRPVWLAVTVDDEDGARLRSGEPLSDLAALDPDAWLANCSAPEAVTTALDTLGTFGKPFGGYANGFQQITKEFLKDKPTVDALSARPEMTPERYADIAMSWVDRGATIVGGCCEIGPAHIRAIADRLRAAGHNIV